MFRKSFTLTNGSGELIRGDLRYSEGTKNAPVIIICHGFKGFKDWGFFPLVSENLAHDGYVTIIFNFSRNGIGSDFQNFTELDKFEQNTFSHELADLKCIVDAVEQGEIGKGIIDSEKIGLLGHSRGGGVALLYASKDERIQSLVTWSAIAKVDRYNEEEKKRWKKEGFIEVENKRTKQIFKIGKTFLEDITKNSKKLDIRDAASELDIPTLIIHGEQDEAVPVDEAKRIYEKLNTYSKALEIIEDATHTYGMSHPVEGISRQYEIVFDLTESWFDNHLNIWPE